MFILTMPTALGRRSGAVYGKKSPKTHLVRMYCKFDHLISNVCVAHCIRRPAPILFSPGSNLGGTAFFFLIFFFFF